MYCSFLHYVNLLIEQNGNQSLKDAKAGFVAQHAFSCPIKTDEIVVVVHIVSLFVANLQKINENRNKMMKNFKDDNMLLGYGV